jgi:hypothetical protein
MRQSRFTEALIIGMIKEREALTSDRVRMLLSVNKMLRNARVAVSRGRTAAS